MKKIKDSTETVTIPQQEYAAMKDDISYLSQQVQFLSEQLKLSKRRQFGTSSEKSDPEQQSLFNEAESESNLLLREPELTEVEKHYRKKRANLSNRLPENLPLEIVEHVLTDKEQACPECSGKLHVIGKETVRRELKIIPAKAVIVEHVAYSYACRACEKNADSVPVIKAHVPNAVIKGGFASPESIAHIMAQKFVMAVPLYRQEQEWKRCGIELSRQTMSNWLIKASSAWFEPLYNELRRQLLKHDVLHADETTLQVLNEPGKPAQSKSYMWLYRTSGESKSPVVLYDYQPDRRGERPEKFLENFNGYLHTDGYQAYHALPENIVVVGCWAHARRKFEEAMKLLPKGKQKNSGPYTGKLYCDKLFAIEKELADLPPEERHTKRQELAKPLLDAFSAWLQTNSNSTKSAFASAVKYTREQWPYLVRYLLDGRLEISNNRAERSIKPFVIGRKNFLFANTPLGARASAVIYSIIETAKENGINPYEYLCYIFKFAPNLDLKNNTSHIEKLLPTYFKAASL